jgi:hypothetical protein
MSNDAVVKTRVGFVEEITKATDTKAIKTSFHELVASLLGKEDKKLEHIQELAKNWIGGDMEASKAFNDEIEVYCEKFPVEVGIQLRSSLHSLDKDASLSLRGNLIKEHGITKITDKLFLDLALNAYFRALRCSAIYHALIQNKDGEIQVSQVRTNFLKELSKQIEMANEQFYRFIKQLEQNGTPPVNVKINTKSTFIGQNQQFNKNA